MALNINTQGQEGEAYLTSYRAYVASISQSGTDAPVAKVYFNTLGECTWQRGILRGQNSYPGYFLKTSIPWANYMDKIHIPLFGDWGGDATTYIPLRSGADVVGHYTLYSFADTDTDNVVIAVDVIDNTGQPVDLSVIIGSTVISLPEIKIWEQ